MSEPQIIQDDNVKNLELAYAHDASAESVRLVLDAGADSADGRSGWKWLRLRNGDLMLGVFPRGTTYEAVEMDAAFPGAPPVPTIPERPMPIPADWTVIAYRVPERGERYYTAKRVGRPYTCGQPREKYDDPAGYWIVVPTRPVPIPDGWKVVGYRVPVEGEQYFNEKYAARPYRKTGTSGTTPGDKWIVVPA